MSPDPEETECTEAMFNGKLHFFRLAFYSSSQGSCFMLND